MSVVDPYDAKRRRDAKRYNESVKLVASALNALSVATLVAAFVVPAINSHATYMAIAWLIASVALHFVAHAVLSLMRSED